MLCDRVAITCLVGLLVLATATGSVGAQEPPETPEELATELNDLRDSEALAEYPELDLARSQAVVDLQTGDGVTDSEHERMEHLLIALYAFDRAHEEAEETPIESLEHADEAYAALESMEAAGGEQHASLGMVALERFYANQGERIYEATQDEESTADELELLDAAVHAYERSGDTDRYSEIQLERDERRTQYESDMERHDELVSEAAAYTGDCEAACDGVGTLLTTAPHSSFSEYAQALQSYEASAEAESIATEHGVDESGAAEHRSTALDALVATGAMSAAFVFGYGFTMLGVTVVVMWRLSKWARDARYAARDRIVTPLEGKHV